MILTVIRTSFPPSAVDVGEKYYVEIDTNKVKPVSERTKGFAYLWGDTRHWHWQGEILRYDSDFNWWCEFTSDEKYEDVNVDISAIASEFDKIIF